MKNLYIQIHFASILILTYFFCTNFHRKFRKIEKNRAVFTKWWRSIKIILLGRKWIELKMDNPIARLETSSVPICYLVWKQDKLAPHLGPSLTRELWSKNIRSKLSTEVRQRLFKKRKNGGARWTWTIDPRVMRAVVYHFTQHYPTAMHTMIKQLMSCCNWILSDFAG